MKKGFHRRYAFVRDADGKVEQMVWLGDFPDKPNILYTCCPRCRSTRWVSASCMDCWYRAPLTWDALEHDQVAQKYLQSIPPSGRDATQGGGK